METNCANSVLKSDLIESQSTICNHAEEGVENTKTTLHPIKKSNEESSNNNILSNSSHQTTNGQLTASDEQAIIIKQSSQDQNDMQVCTESSTDNDSVSGKITHDKDINKNIEMNENLDNSLENETSVIFNENAVLKESLQQVVKQLNNHDKPESEISCNVLGLNNSETLLSGNPQLSEISTQNENSNTFGLLPECDPSLLPSNSMKTTDFVPSSLDNSIVISNSNAVPQSDSIVSSNFSLSQLRCYGSDESLNEDSLEVKTFYRDTNHEVDLSDKESDSDSSSTSSSSSIVISDSSDSDSDAEDENVNLPKPIKAKGELDLNDLPPIEDLKISVPEEECIPVGQVFQIVDTLVVIQAFKDKPALNLDSVLFSQEGKPFGKIFDVFGPVAEPYYCVRFNSSDQIKDKNICINQMVYCAPKTKYTNYVFLAQLLKFKGSDASWVDDLEPPEMYLEYSDDEQEQKAKKKASKKSAKNKQQVDPDEPASKKHFYYEKKMNKRNLQMSAARRKPANQIENSLWSPSSTFTDVASSSNSSIPNIPHQLFGRPPAFSPRMPPTGYFSPNPDRSNRFSHRPDMFPATPDRFSPGPNMFSPRPDKFPSTSNRFPPRPDMMVPPRPDMIPPRPDMFSPRHEMFPPRQDIFPPRPDMFQARPDMFPPRPLMLQSRPSNGFLGSNNPMHQPFNSFSPPNSTDLNSSVRFPHQIQPTMSQGQMGNPQTISPIGPPRICYNGNNHTSRNSFPNQLGSPHGNLPNGNLWVQRPQSPSLGSAPLNSWPPPHTNNQTNPHAYPPSNPF